jgi:hypothetical protein
MITGDAAVVESGELVVANPRFMLDMQRAQESLEKIWNYPADTFLCYHGGIFHRTR